MTKAFTTRRLKEETYQKAIKYLNEDLEYMGDFLANKINEYVAKKDKEKAKENK